MRKSIKVRRMGRVVALASVILCMGGERAEASPIYIDCGRLVPQLDRIVGETQLALLQVRTYTHQIMAQDPLGYETWFGPWDPGRATLVRAKFDEMFARADGNDWVIECNGDHPLCERSHAIVRRPGHTVFLCASYWSLPLIAAENMSDQRTVLAHEISHFDEIFPTVNAQQYGMDTSPMRLRELLKLDPTSAYTWAESYEYMTWSAPIYLSLRKEAGCRASRRADELDLALLLLLLLPGAIILRRRRAMKVATPLLIVSAAAFAVGLPVALRMRANADGRTPQPSLPAVTFPVTPVPATVWLEKESPVETRFTCEVEAPRELRFGDPLPVTFRLTNVSDKSVWLYNGGTPFDPPNMEPWMATLDGKKLPHFMDGYALKRVSPQLDEFRRIEPGESAAVTKDLFDPRGGGYTLTGTGTLEIARSTTLLETWDAEGVTEEDLAVRRRGGPSRFVTTRIDCPHRLVDVRR